MPGRGRRARRSIGCWASDRLGVANDTRSEAVAQSVVRVGFETAWMSQNFLSCDRDQALLLAPDMREWLPGDHLARFVIETVGQLDLRAVYAAYRADGRGRAAHDPAMMIALLLYAYSVGVRSSRVIERRCVEDVAFRVIAANRAPDHVTIARFRGLHQAALSGLFDEVLALCRDAGMVRVGVVAIDSTKLAANASLGANHSERGLRGLADRIFAEAAEIDAREDELYGDRRGDELPDELADPRTRGAKIKELLERARAAREQAEQAHADQVQARQAARAAGQPGRPPGPGLPVVQARRLERQQYNLTDPDSAIVRHRGMLLQGYNVQTAVADGQVILAARATSVSPDHGQLAPTLAAAVECLERIDIAEPVEQVLADSGYWHGEQIRQLHQHGQKVLIPPPRRQRSPGHEGQPEAIAMRAALDDPHTQRLYRRRAQIVEPVFAHIKYLRGITRVFRRGHVAVQAEIDLIATTHNLLKLYRHTPTAA